MGASLQKQGASSASKEEEKKEFDMFEAAMKKNWREVAEEYKKNPSACETKLTKSEQTALHIAVSCYNTDSKESATHLDCITEMVNAIPEGKAMEVLSLKDANGNTPLHLAARHGSVSLCEKIALGRWKLIALRNNKNETPLFLAAHRGKLGAFFCLRKIYREKQSPDGKAQEGDVRDKKEPGPDEKGQARERDQFEAEINLCRRKDGNTVLHSAIFGEYYRLAFQIIEYYPELVNSVNVNGESPLHVLAKKPNSFRSSSHLRFYDSIIYQCVYAPKLKKESCDHCTHERPSDSKTPFGCPGNYKTCVGLYELLGKVIRRFFGSICPLPRRADVENPDDNQKKPLPSGKTDKGSAQNHEEQPEDDEDRYGRFPANYATFIRFSKFMIMFLLIIFGIGHHKIKKMREKKERHKWATQIMNKMIQVETSYKYDSNGQAPTQKLRKNLTQIDLPDAPPSEDDSDTSSDVKKKDEEENGSDKKGDKFLNALQETAKELNTEKNFVLVTYDKGQQTGIKRQETPFLIAAKTGITEMVEKILDKIEVAINDVDENDKNALLLAVEHRQTKVFHFLLDRNLPEFVIHQVDSEGNSARHLAAMFRPNNPWRLPGAALQMHGEVTWFKHVKKNLPPLRFSHYNQNGETPRDVFRIRHEDLAKAGTEWLIKTSESCSVIAALIATVAFATSVTVPGGVDENSGQPLLVNHPLFNVFSISSLVALCFSLTALVFFLAIITSRCQVWDFKTNLPRKLLMGLSCLFTSIAAILVSFCAGHFFVLKENLQYAALPIYAATSVPLTIFAFAQLPLYFDLTQAVLAQVPVRSYKVFYR